MPLDWDKLRIFNAAAEAGSFTHAGEALGLSQSAVSRQVSALEQELNVPLFHRHARGLVLTEQGDLLFRASQDVVDRLETVRTKLMDSKDKPSGELRVTTTVGLGANWLTPRLREFIELYPDVELQLILSDSELDLGMREADVAIRLRRPIQPDLVQRKLFTVHFHLYASGDYLRRWGTPSTAADLIKHKVLLYGEPAPAYFREMNWLERQGPDGEPHPRVALRINSVYGLKQAVQSGEGIAILPDYIIGTSGNLIRLGIEADDLPCFDTYFVYPEELRTSARINVFRDFLVAKAREWSY